MEVFTSTEKLIWDPSHSRPWDWMWDGGKSCIFSHSLQKWWNDVLVKTNLPSDHVPWLAYVLHYSPCIAHHLVCANPWSLWWQTWEMYLHLCFPLHLHSLQKGDAYLQSFSLNEKTCPHCVLYSVERSPWLIAAIWIPPQQAWNPQCWLRREVWASSHISCNYTIQLSTRFLLNLWFFTFSLARLSPDWKWHSSRGISMISLLRWDGWNGVTD